MLLAQVFVCFSLFLSVCALCYTVETKNLFCCLRRFSFVSLCFFLSVLCTTQSKLKTCYCCLRRLLSVSLCVCVCLSVSVCVCVCLRLSGFVYLCLYNIYIYIH